MKKSLSVVPCLWHQFCTNLYIEKPDTLLETSGYVAQTWLLARCGQSGPFSEQYFESIQLNEILLKFQSETLEWLSLRKKGPNKFTLKASIE